MIIIELLLSIVVILVVPFLVGDLVLPHNEAITKRYIIGFITTLAISQIVYFPLVCFNQWRYSPFYYAYLTVIGILCTISVYKLFKNSSIKVSCILTINRLCSFNIWKLLSCVLIGVQIVRGLIGRFYVYADDAHYIPWMNDMIETDRYNNVYYVNGIVNYHETDIKVMLSTYFPYLDSISKFSGLHPSILVQTILPVFFMITIYVLVWHYGLLLFKSIRNSWIFVFVFAVLIETTSGYLLTFSNHVIVANYYGKKIVFTIIIPYLLLFIAERTALLEERVHLLEKKDVIRLFIISLGACAPSLMGTGLVPIVLFSIGIVLSFRQKSIVPMGQMVIAMIPSITVLFMAFLYLYSNV